MTSCLKAKPEQLSVYAQWLQGLGFGGNVSPALTSSMEAPQPAAAGGAPNRGADCAAGADAAPPNAGAAQPDAAAEEGVVEDASGVKKLGSVVIAAKTRASLM